ncbi:unnamed protein product [Moneuplotes crassus]|uniref:Uncharacterized protein n=2 Tax=Euplotes crassus TaxID=5936 RepID=A0AAD1U268_EUPCR|nr:unnamed protein product [Moneuplotes crassus]
MSQQDYTQSVQLPNRVSAFQRYSMKKKSIFNKKKMAFKKLKTKKPSIAAPLKLNFRSSKIEFPAPKENLPVELSPIQECKVKKIKKVNPIKRGRYHFNVEKMLQDSRVSVYSKIIKKAMDDLITKPKKINRKSSKRDEILAQNRTPLSFRTHDEEQILMNNTQGRMSNAFSLNSRFSMIKNTTIDQRHFSMRKAFSPQPNSNGWLKSPTMTRSRHMSPSETTNKQVSDSSLCSRNEIIEELRKKIYVVNQNKSKKKKKSVTAFLSLPRRFNKDLMDQVISNLLQTKAKKRVPQSLKKDPEFQRRFSRYSILSPILRGPRFTLNDDNPSQETTNINSPFSLTSDKSIPTVDNIVNRKETMRKKSRQSRFIHL